MSEACLIWDPRLADHDLGESHPFDPRRLTLAVDLMEAYGLLSPGRVILPCPAKEEELLLVHSSGYIEAVLESSDWGTGLHAGSGLGTEDNPIFPGMHDFAELTCGGSIVAVEEVVSGRRPKTFGIAGGLHHAHRSRASGFSVYNDPAVAIAVARSRHPGLRALYIDVDAHHGDGVQEAFGGVADVLTISIHESGVWLFPGTGFPGEIGYGEGEGFSVNVPLPPLAGDACFELAFAEVVGPLARAFGPDVIVAQLGVDAHHLDPQADLVLTLPGYRSVVRRIIGLADELCDGKLAALGGGGYNLATVPRAWAWVMAELAGVTLAEELPASWLARAPELGLAEPPQTLGADDAVSIAEPEAASALEATESAIAEVRRAVFPHHGLVP
jgi:acetoin utilization protein AcuC